MNRSWKQLSPERLFDEDCSNELRRFIVNNPCTEGFKFSPFMNHVYNLLKRTPNQKCKYSKKKKQEYTKRARKFEQVFYLH